MNTINTYSYALPSRFEVINRMREEQRLMMERLNLLIEDAKSGTTTKIEKVLTKSLFSQKTL
jgi:hypothetical protein